MRPRSRLRTRVIFAVLGGAVLVAVGVALLLVNTISLRDTADSTVRADAFVSRVVNVERLVVDVATGLRGYAITGHKLFLQPLHRARVQSPGAIAALQKSASDAHAYRQQTAVLVSAVRSYESGYVPHVLRMAARNLGAARSLAVTLAGKRAVDGIRRRAQTLEQLVSAREVRRQAAAHRSADSSIAEAIVVLVLVTALTCGVGGYLGHLVVERDRARERSEKTTRTLQQSVLPTRAPAIRGCELATRFIPAGDVVSGDFYDALEIGRGRWGLIIGDVCGKGPEAAALTAMARWTLLSSLASGEAPADALRFLNRAMLQRELDRRFLTAACMVVTIGPEQAHAVVGCAGHPAPIFLPAVGEPVAVSASGDLLGMVPTVRLRTADVELLPGESLVAYTDGVTDRGAESGRSPEQALSEPGPGAGAQQLADAVETLAHESPGRHPDDIAIVVLRFLGEKAQAPLAGAAHTRSRTPDV